MATVEADLRGLLIGDANFARKCPRLHVNHVPEPQRKFFPFGWMAMATQDFFTCIDDSVGDSTPAEYLFDFEFYAENPSDALAVAALARAKLNNFRGTMGSRTAQAIFVSNQSQDYIPRGLGSDIGEHYTALTVRVIA